MKTDIEKCNFFLFSGESTSDNGFSDALAIGACTKKKCYNFTAEIWKGNIGMSTDLGVSI